MEPIDPNAEPQEGSDAVDLGPVDAEPIQDQDEAEDEAPAEPKKKGGK